MLIPGFTHHTVKYLAWLNKRTNTNPKRGPRHYKSPSKILWRAIRGMLPHKTARGAAALAHLKIFEGVPPPYDKMKRLVVPSALRVLRLSPWRKYTVLGELCEQIGWKHSALIKRLEEKRKVRAAAFYARKKALAKLRKQAAESIKA